MKTTLLFLSLAFSCFSMAQEVKTEEKKTETSSSKKRNGSDQITFTACENN
jgi:hypothetical protein